MGSVEAGEEALWSRSLRGEGEAFGVLYDRHRDRVFHHAYRVCGNHHDAEDIMASAFLELWRRRQDVRVVEGSILPWLLVTTTNVARNHGRAGRRYRKLLDSLPRSQDRSDSTAEEGPLGLQGQLDHDLSSALGTLKPIDLHLVTLVVFEEYTLAAAAAALNISPAAAKSRMHRARQHLRAALTRAHPQMTPARTPALEGEGL
ncbi:RNA polymerase sigma factor [Sinomonas gamaensis]|uniref:RNA polymerase sigma factor n=1 Tax=Sinomonas gamaensis TaxID=2565624 RepID=UPI001107C97A|nr:RNA polymerase sigma factor [Sinomonas gamaensis]